MIGKDDIHAAGVNIANLLYQVAIQNAKVVSDAPDEVLSVVFNALVAATSRSIAVGAAGSRKMDPGEWTDLLRKIHRELMASSQDIMTRHAGDGFKMIVFDR